MPGSKREWMRQVLDELSLKRDRNRRRMEQARAQIEQEVPQWADIERQIGALQAAAARQALADPSSAQTVAEETAQTVAVLRSRQAQLLESEGIDPAALELQFDCPLCRDTGFADAQGRVLCTCAQRRLAELCARDSGLEAFPRHTFKDFDESIFPQGGAQNQRAQMLRLRDFCLDYARAFPKNETHNILLMGAPGLGKTFLMHCIASEVIRRGFSVLTTTAYRLQEALLEQPLGGGYERCSALYLTPELLVLDDLGAEPRISNVTLEQLFAVLNERMISGKGTLITTNLTLPELRDRYRDRVISRLIDPQQTATFLLTGQDVRLRRDGSQG